MKFIPDIKKELRKQFHLHARCDFAFDESASEPRVTGDTGGYYLASNGKVVHKAYAKYDFGTRYVACSQSFLASAKWLQLWIEDRPKLKRTYIRKMMKGEV